MKYVKYEFCFPDTYGWAKHEANVTEKIDEEVKKLLSEYPSLQFRKVYDDRWRWTNPEDRI